MELVEYAPGQVVFKQGAVGDRLFVIREGSARVTKAPAGVQAQQQTLAKLTAGAFFGERALAKDEVRQAALPGALHSPARHAAPCQAGRCTECSD